MQVILPIDPNREFVRRTVQRSTRQNVCTRQFSVFEKAAVCLRWFAETKRLLLFIRNAICISLLGSFTHRMHDESDQDLNGQSARKVNGNSRKVTGNSRKEEKQEITAMIRVCGLAMFVTHSSQGLLATPLPLFYAEGEGEFVTLHGHTAKANPQWQDISTEDAVVIFQGVNSTSRHRGIPPRKRMDVLCPRGTTLPYMPMARSNSTRTRSAFCKAELT